MIAKSKIMMSPRCDRKNTGMSYQPLAIPSRFVGSGWMIKSMDIKQEMPDEGLERQTKTSNSACPRNEMGGGTRGMGTNHESCTNERRSNVRKISSFGMGDGVEIGMLDARNVVAFFVELLPESMTEWTTSLAMTSP